ncbi:hypothetical protein [Aquabacterium sp.]|uniref:hypothetical protein n=1 Tax=Aquabacterium sp. TaxID=1872578 RepID=UPI002487AC58|nr:hypothetical protein [Aquabacterium sp.]MDI1258283.1 hypothetical protein [Aquabacterium sp.]
MSVSTSSLCAETCETITAIGFAAEVDGEPAESFSAPLGDCISFPNASEKAAQQAASYVQLTAAVLAMRYPWMSFKGLYRFIIASDRNAVIEANAHHLGRLYPDLEDLKSRSGAFAFPMNCGIVVVMPAHVMAYAFAPDSEVERQYGLTTIWHELAHVADLSLHYLADGGKGLVFQATSTLNARQIWHEYFADRHSHWPGFSVSFELELVEKALNDIGHSKSRSNIQALAVRLGSAHGRLTAEGSQLSLAAPGVSAKLASLGIAQPWRSCAEALDEALDQLIRTGRPPNLQRVEAALGRLQAVVATSL